MNGFYLLIILVNCVVNNVTGHEHNTKPKVRHGFARYIVRPRFGSRVKKTYVVDVEEVKDNEKTNIACDWIKRNCVQKDTIRGEKHDVEDTTITMSDDQRPKGYMPYRMRHRYFGGKKKDQVNKKDMLTTKGVTEGRYITTGDNYKKSIRYTTLDKNAMHVGKRTLSVLNNEANMKKKERMEDINADDKMYERGIENIQKGEDRDATVTSNRYDELRYIIAPSDMSIDVKHNDGNKVVANEQIEGGEKVKMFENELNDNMKKKVNVYFLRKKKRRTKDNYHVPRGTNNDDKRMSRATDSHKTKQNVDRIMKKKSISEYQVGGDEVERSLSPNDYWNINRAVTNLLDDKDKNNVEDVSVDEGTEWEEFTNTDDVIGGDETV